MFLHFANNRRLDCSTMQCSTLGRACRFETLQEIGTEGLSLVKTIGSTVFDLRLNFLDKITFGVILICMAIADGYTPAWFLKFGELVLAHLLRFFFNPRSW